MCTAGQTSRQASSCRSASTAWLNSSTSAPLGVGRKILIHINNTNPVLLDDSPERAAVRAEDVVVGNSADSFLTDARGRKYIDFMMGWCVGNLGWGNTEIAAAARKFDGPD